MLNEVGIGCGHKSTIQWVWQEGQLKKFLLPTLLMVLSLKNGLSNLNLILIH